MESGIIIGRKYEQITSYDRAEYKVDILFCRVLSEDLNISSVIEILGVSHKPLFESSAHCGARIGEWNLALLIREAVNLNFGSFSSCPRDVQNWSLGQTRPFRRANGMSLSSLVWRNELFRNLYIGRNHYQWRIWGGGARGAPHPLRIKVYLIS